MKPLRYTRHAKRAMRLWAIRPEEVETTLLSPDRTLPTGKERLNAIKQSGDHFLRVTYKEETDHYLVVTVTPRRKPW